MTHRASRLIWKALAMLAVGWCAALATAAVVGVEIESRQVVLDGRSFGDVGAYEKLTGTIHFAVDPANPANARIVDLDLAPRNQDGLVEASANFMALQPVDASKGRGVALVEVSNRGGKASLSYFNRAARSVDPVAAEEFGDGLLMRMGLTVIWVGWQTDVPDKPGRLRLSAPIARGIDGSAISGLVRSDWVVDEPATTLSLAHYDHIAYPVADAEDPVNVLTVRSGRLAPRRVIERSAWRFAREQDGRLIDDATHITLKGGFEPGDIYECVYRAKNPRIVGLGLAAIRDVMSYTKHDQRSPFHARFGVAFGVSQTGRFLRQFLYQGFNTDEKGRKVYDGLLIHTAGAGRGSFNHRFGQPSRDAHRYSAFFYPTDIFPFTSLTQRDPVTGLSDGLLAHLLVASHMPKVFYTNTGYEYWGRSASLIHTSADGERDIEPAPNERIYHFAGAQHFVDRFPPSEDRRAPGSRAYRGNSLDLLLPLRAALSNLIDWVADGVEPPASTQPHLSDGSLVAIDEMRFPAIPGVEAPRVAQEAYRVDYGPRWSVGVIDIQPPNLGPAFPVRVPQVNALGNEVGGVRSVEIQTPIATYTPWSLRVGAPGATHELANFRGWFIPLPRTEKEREALGDPRPSVESLYTSREAYLAQAAAAAKRLAARRWLLVEDIPHAVRKAADRWDWLMAQ